MKTLKLPPAPIDRITLEVWQEVATFPQPWSTKRRMVKKCKQGWQTRCGPWAEDRIVADVFVAQSALVRILNRHSLYVLELIPPEAVASAHVMTLRPETSWLSAVESILFEWVPGLNRQTAVVPYAMCIATGDPFELQAGLEKLAAEAWYEPLAEGRNILVDQVKEFLHGLGPSKLRDALTYKLKDK